MEAVDHQKKKFSINFTKANTKFSLSLHYNADYNYNLHYNAYFLLIEKKSLNLKFTV